MNDMTLDRDISHAGSSKTSSKVKVVGQDRAGSGSPGQRFWPGRVGSRVSVDPVFDPGLWFNMRVYPSVVSTE